MQHTVESGGVCLRFAGGGDGLPGAAPASAPRPAGAPHCARPYHHGLGNTTAGPVGTLPGGR